ncbi:MAG: hypothetical protein CL946_02425 [Ectothiorhodospiraceae bacterium]|nr:hypothetical protein [Ectothiorhodospiraceae bacterium]
MGNTHHILVISSREVDDLLVKSELQKSRFTLRARRVKSLSELGEALDSQAWSLAVANYSSEQFSGLDVLKIIRNRQPELTTIVLSDTEDVDSAVAAMKAGAYDYIQKKSIARLLPAVERFLTVGKNDRDKDTYSPSETVFQKVAHSVKDVIYIWDVEEQSVWRNDGYGLIFEQGEFSKETDGWWAESIHAADKERVLQEFQSTSESEEEVWQASYRLKRKNGSYAYVEDRGYIVRNSEGKIAQIIGAAADVTEREYLRERLDTMRNSTHRFFKAFPTPIWQVNEDLELLSMNPATESLFAGDRQNKKSWLSAFPEDEIHLISDAVSYAISTERPKTCYANIHLGSEVRPCSLQCISTAVGDGATSVCTIIASIPEGQAHESTFPALVDEGDSLPLTEEASGESAENLRAVLENTNDSIWSIDREYRVKALNSVFREKFSLLYGTELAIGTRILDSLPETPLHFWKERYERAFRGEGFTEVTSFDWLDDPRSYEIMFNPMFSGSEVIGVSVFARDITERVEQERAMQRLQERDEMISSISTEFLNVEFDKVGEAVDNALAKLAEYLQIECTIFTAEDGDDSALFHICGAEDQVSAVTLVFSDEKSHEWMHTKLRSRERVLCDEASELPSSSEQTMRILAASGLHTFALLPLSIQNEYFGAIGAYDEDGKQWTDEEIETLESVGELIVNIIQRKRTREALETERQLLAERVEDRTAELRTANAELARAARMKDEFLANMSHELRTPLSAILGLAESLLEQLGQRLNEKQRNSLLTIDESGRHLLKLINDILDLSKIESGHLSVQKEEVELDLLCQSSLLFVRQQALKKDIDLNYKISDRRLSMQSDSTRLKQILVNLLNNAVKFTPRGGQITFEVQGYEERNTIEFSISDTGIGIEPEHMSKLFKPFVQLDSSLTRQYEGTGLGLALVASLTDLLGGSVRVDSEPGKWSRFTVTLPWIPEFSADEEPDSSLVEEEGLEYNGRSISVLLAEDNETNIFTIMNYLTSKGMAVQVAHDGLETLHMLRKERPDVLIMDIHMPLMDGFQTIERIREEEQYRDLPIIALTALAMPGDRERCIECGANEYLSKPVRLKELTASIHQHVMSESAPAVSSDG